jgi:hypothetical protein
VLDDEEGNQQKPDEQDVEVVAQARPDRRQAGGRRSRQRGIPVEMRNEVIRLCRRMVVPTSGTAL